ncbi:MAG: 3-hydroxyacyl-CoA dehydrogenase NAD-binding domain-containing protein [Segetibacter sp.]
MIKTICVCGAGTMGSGIAQVAAQSGFSTILFDVNGEMLEKSRTNIQKNIHVQISRNKLSAVESSAILSSLIFTNNIKDCSADIIIEAIVEKLDAKVELFNHLAVTNNPETIFATNTSSLSITDIAGRVTCSTQVVGMHFFNPAPVMKLVEVVKGRQTSGEVVKEVYELAKQLGKTPVLCKDAPGFIVNRVARPYYLEALRLIELGVTDIETIDKVLEAAGFRMGPFKLMDMIGMDVNYNVSSIVWKALGEPDRLTTSPIQKAKLDAGELGRKTGKGFYDYSK